MTRVAIFALSIAVALAVNPACAHSQGNSIFDSGEHLWVVGNVRVPAVADTFALLRVNRYPALSLGVSLTYGSPLVRELDLTIYVFPVPEDSDDPLQEAFEQALREVDQYAAQRRPPWTVTMQPEEPYRLVTESGLDLEGMFAEGEYVRSGRSSPTLVYVFRKSGLILKYRVTYEESAPPGLRQHIEAWVRITAERIDSFGR